MASYGSWGGSICRIWIPHWESAKGKRTESKLADPLRKTDSQEGGLDLRKRVIPGKPTTWGYKVISSAKSCEWIYLILVFDRTLFPITALYLRCTHLRGGGSGGEIEERQHK